MSERFDREAERLAMLFPSGLRIVVIGSTDFWHGESERTCAHIGRLLAEILDLVLITGGVEGIGEAVGRSYFQARVALGQVPRVYHVLPHGEEAWDYGETLFAGSDMRERREILARLAPLYLAVEGGPGTVHEAEVASARNAVILPVGRSSGLDAGRDGKRGRASRAILFGNGWLSFTVERRFEPIRRFDEEWNMRFEIRIHSANNHDCFTVEWNPKRSTAR